MGTQKTNLQNVKCVAHMLLYVDIQTTAFSPMVVSHPFTNDGIVRLLDDTGNITLSVHVLQLLAGGGAAVHVQEMAAADLLQI